MSGQPTGPDPGRKSEQEEYASLIKQVGIWMTLPIILAAAPLTGFFIGRWLDNRFNTAPWATIAFLILGAIAAGRETKRLIQASKRIQEYEDQNK